MPRLRLTHHTNFTTIGNNLIQNTALSWKARGLIIYLLSMPDDWNFNLSDLANRAPDGRAALRSGIKELKEQGYIEIVKERSNGGQFDGWTWYVYEDPPKCENRTSVEPKVEKPISDNPKSENPKSDNRPLLRKQGTKETETKETGYKKTAAVAPSSDPDLDDIEWNDGQGQHEKPSVLKDPRASDPITLGQACAERQEEEAAKGRPPGWTVPGGAEPIPDAMVTAWVTAKGLVPEQIPKELLDQYRRAMASAIEGLSATEDQAARAVRHVLTHPDYAWYSYNHPKVEKFKQDVQGVILQILSGRLKANGDGEIVEDVPDEILAQGTGLSAILAHGRLKEKAARERGEPVPKSMFPSLNE